jgi:hypothetical protein
VLRVGQLWRSSGPIAAPDAVGEGPPAIGAWGEGLVDRSLTSLWYPADWSEVGDDELVFMLPTLSAWRPGSREATPSPPGGPVRYLTRILKARALAAAELISQAPHAAPAANRLQALELLSARSILTTIPLAEIATTATTLRRIPRPPAASLPAKSTAEATSLPDWLALELTALAHLDRLLRDARGAGNGSGPSPLVDWPLALTDVVVATINARLNGVYVYPEFAHAHELLTAAALLGHLASGRTAYLPPHVAQSLIDLLSGSEAAAAVAEDDWCAAVVRMYAELAGGVEHTLSFARRALASGRPCLARPRRPVAPFDTGRTTWNARLLQRIDLRWHVSA